MLKLAYLLAAAVKELFPKSKLLQTCSSEDIFFCDIHFPETFAHEMLPFLEERMSQLQKEPFQVLEMVPENGAQLLEAKGEAALAKECREKTGLITVVQLGNFFFLAEGKILETNPTFKLAMFWNLKKKTRILGACGSKEQIKATVKQLKGLEPVEQGLERRELISWVGDQLVWERKGEELKDILKKRLLELYAGFDRVFVGGNVEKILRERWKQTGRKAVQIGTSWIENRSQEAWDSGVISGDKSCGNAEEITSFLHLATKFLTMLSFDYQVIGIGRISGEIKKFLDLDEGGGGRPRIECRVVDGLGQTWTVSTLAWDRECVWMSVCCSFERCIALAKGIEQLENK